METKICTKCNELKLLTRFQFRKNRGYYATVCKDCTNIYNKMYRQKPGVKEKEHLIQKIWRDNNKEYLNTYRYERYNNDNNYKNLRIVRSRLNQALKSQNASKSEHTFDLISCSTHELNDWLEFTKPYFIPEDYEGQLHIDHFKPLSKFNLNNHDELKEACHWSNLRYLTQEQNLKKSNKNPSPSDKFKMLVLKKFYISNFSDTSKLRETCDDTSTTTSSEKSFEGTEVMTLPNGNNVEV